MLITCVLWGVSVVLTALLYFTEAICSPWWVLLLLPGLYLAAGLCYMLLLIVMSFFLPKKEEQSHKEWCRIIIVETSRWLIPLLHMRVRLIGDEKLPTDKPFLLVCNHRSNFDPIITMAAMPRQRICFVSKPENFRIILAGRLMRCASFLAIDRENARKAATTIHRAAEYITDRGLVMGIYPEGTRSKTGELLEFRNGAFKIAKLANCPVAVLTIRDSGHRHFFSPRVMELHVVEVLDESYVADNRTTVISEHAKALIEADLSK